MTCSCACTAGTGGGGGGGGGGHVPPVPPLRSATGMSLHEKEGNKSNLHQADNPSLHLCFKKWFALFGSERQDLLQSNCMLLVQEQRNKK